MRTTKRDRTPPGRRGLRCRPQGERVEERLCLSSRPAITSITANPTVVEGGTATLEVRFDDDRDLSHEVTVTWGDGDADRFALAHGKRSFRLDHVYRDDNPSGAPDGSVPIEVSITAGPLLVGTDVVFVVDVSGSTADLFAGTPVGDQNGDGRGNTILDAEIAGFKGLTQGLIDRGLGNTSKVSIVAFDSSGHQLDMDPAQPGTQLATTPLADRDHDGVRDVDEALGSLRPNSSTNFEVALQKAIATITALGTAPGKGSVIFLSDGYPTAGGSFTDETNRIRSDLGQNLKAFGVGSGSSLTQLRLIDATAVQFTRTDELLAALSGSGSVGGGTAKAGVRTRVVNAAPAADAGADQKVDEGGVVELIGSFTDPGSIDTHTLHWRVTDGGGRVVAEGHDAALRFTPPRAGVYAATFTVVDGSGGTGLDNAVISVMPAPDRTGPTIQGIRSQTTRLVLTFSEGLDAARAADLGNYSLIAPGRDRRFGTRDDRSIRLSSATYDAAAHAVTLVPIHRLDRNRRYRMKVNGTSPTGVVDLTGNRLDGDENGRPGGEYVRVFRASVWHPRGPRAGPSGAVARAAGTSAPSIGG